MEKLFWKVKHTGNFNKEYDLLETVLKENGVEDVDAFLNVSVKNTFDPSLFTNIQTGLELLHSTLQKEKPHIYVKIDSDVDGITSGTATMLMIREINPHTVFDYAISEDKIHGIFYKDVKDCVDLDLIIVPDAGSDSIEDCSLIQKNMNVPILILDHHLITNPKIHKYATVINCTDGTYPNPTLSGVGVVYKFFKAYCGKYGLSGLDVCDKYLQLISLGMIADNMDLRNLETRYYVLRGLKEEFHTNDFLKEMVLVEEEAFKFGHTVTNYGWSLAPYLNALVRYGKPEEQINTIRAILGEQEIIEYQPRRKKASDPKPPIEYHSLQKTMARICSNCRSRQNSEVKRFMEKLSEKINNERLNDNTIIIVDGSEILTKKTVTGLVANKLTTAYKRPAVVLKNYSNDIWGGSARGYGKGNISDFNTFLNESGLIVAKGHPNAMGVELPKNNYEALVNYCNSHIDKNDLVDTYEVDYEIEADSLKLESVMRIANAHTLWGGGIEKPTFAITNIHIPAKNIAGFSKEGSDYIGFIRFTYNGITYIKKYCKKTDFDELTLKGRTSFGENKKQLNITVIASISLDEYEDKRYPQIVIEQFYSEEDDGKANEKIINTEVELKKKKVFVDEDFIF